MGKVIDITEKLSFEENPRLSIKGAEIEVNADAETVLTILGQMNEENGLSYAQVPNLLKKLFTADGRKKLSALHLSLNDYMVVINAAVNLITDTGEEHEESAEDPTTT